MRKKAMPDIWSNHACLERQVSVLECDVSVESYSYKAEEMDLKVNGGAGFLYGKNYVKANIRYLIFKISDLAVPE